MIFYKNVLQPAYLSPQINYKMKKLNDTAITVLAIVSTILSYPSWLPVVLVGNLFSSLAPAIYYIIFLVFSLALFFACKSLYRFYNRTESARAALWGQIGFIFLVSFTIKFIFDNLLILPGSLWGAGAIYGIDLIVVAPINVFVSLKIAHRKIDCPLGGWWQWFCLGCCRSVNSRIPACKSLGYRTGCTGIGCSLSLRRAVRVEYPRRSLFPAYLFPAYFRSTNRFS